ncbi:cysteine hydrolase family protein [Oceanospirillum sediminis]|uniref:Cysteine hydrolase n=1 Tax=Oceanospirillum sediminis TaxID=2760088 RepID=A0A839IX76_9GAMM|nr:cysteine hydrolase family protein [Oceanospirillum sediminis]MBB1488977.1 cysteine hydrolase [Oceanospirillum sediminis]
MTKAVLVIDVQSLLFDTTPAPFEGTEVVARINHVTQWAREQSCPVIFIQHEQADTPIAAGSEGWQLQKDLEVQPEDLIVAKTTPDSFLRTRLQKVLQELEINELIVCGYASEFCIDSTVRRAAGLGYNITLVADAHTTHDKEHMSGEAIRKHHTATLMDISSFGVALNAITTKELVNL